MNTHIHTDMYIHTNKTHTYIYEYTDNIFFMKTVFLHIKIPKMYYLSQYLSYNLIKSIRTLYTLK